jgi:hypothetical protein
MIYVNLIESIRQIKNQVEVISTVQNSNNEEYLGIAKFFLRPGDNLPEDEDDLACYIENMELEWSPYSLNFRTHNITSN